jgi:hypothetical protein
MVPHDAVRVRFGMLALAACGVVTGAMIVVRGPFVDPAVNPEPFVQIAGTPRFVAYSLGTVVGVLLGVYGYLALYAYLAYTDRRVARLASWGLVLNIGLVLLLPSLGVYAFVGPPLTELYAVEPQRAIALAQGLGSGGYLALVLLQAVMYCVGSLLFGIAIWRSGTLPRWAGVLYFLQAPLIEFVPLVSYPGEIIGAFMLAASSAWIAYRAAYTLSK